MNKNPVKAIKEKCLDCCGGMMNEVRECPSTQCPIWAFRLGKNPYRTARVMTEEQKEAARVRFAKIRESQMGKNE